MGRRGGLIAGVAAAVVALAAAACRPVRYVVDGVSMAPAFAAGDVVRSGWCPAADRWRRPRRFDRWTITATDGIAIKRVVGLPGEHVEIRDGDLVIAGRPVLKSPRLLAEMGRVVADEAAAASGGAGPWSAAPREVLDDSAEAVTRSHVLLPVRDTGLAAIVRVRELPAEGFVRVRVRVAGRIVPWRLTAVGRHAVVAGRLDGHLVAAAWRVPDAGGAGETVYSCLPAAAPDRWQVVEAWRTDGGVTTLSPQLSIRCDAPARAAAVERISMWRDVLYRHGANGIGSWSLGHDECFVLGDHPAASTDSRRWGPVPRRDLRHRIP